jgi:integrase
VDVRWTHPDGRKERVRLRSPIQTRRGAEEYERQVRSELLAGTFGKEVTEAPTLGAFAPTFLDHCRADRQKGSSVAAKTSILEHHLIPTLGKVRLDQIAETDVLRLKTSLADRSPKTTNNVLSVLSTLLKVAVGLGLIEHVPVAIRFVRAPKPEMRFLEDHELDRLLDAARKRDRETFTAVLLGADAGLRVGEMAAIEWPDVDLARRQLRVRQGLWKDTTDAPKGGRYKPAICFDIGTVTKHEFSPPRGLPRAFRGPRYVRKNPRYTAAENRRFGRIREYPLEFVGAKEAERQFKARKPRRGRK